eukprot:TRINITY_DN18233_c0_g1_i1.p1 TRINITY_DN18233_c0_g1~~TRINITY_DN18233_c0_g1_i1.p1  ORF type:complete len:131 (+),score=8.17 TRINITY_DN18233_c0_g1_i1:79-471(+)
MVALFGEFSGGLLTQRKCPPVRTHTLHILRYILCMYDRLCVALSSVSPGFHLLEVYGADGKQRFFLDGSLIGETNIQITVNVARISGSGGGGADWNTPFTDLTLISCPSVAFSVFFRHDCAILSMIMMSH